MQSNKKLLLFWNRIFPVNYFPSSFWVCMAVFLNWILINITAINFQTFPIIQSALRFYLLSIWRRCQILFNLIPGKNLGWNSSGVEFSWGYFFFFWRGITGGLGRERFDWKEFIGKNLQERICFRKSHRGI